MVVGGSGKQLAMTANGLLLKGHQVFVYTYCGKELSHKLNENVVYIPQNPLPRNKLTEYLFSIVNVRKQIKKIRPDVVISWRCNAAFFVNLASLGLKVKTIFSERNDPNNVSSLFIKIASFVSEFSSGGVFQLENIRKYYKKLYKKSIVIPNPIAIESCENDLQACNQREKKIVNVGRMYIPQKRQDVMLEAFKEFTKNHPDYTLHFLGDGRDLEYVKKMAQNLDLSEKVFFHGAVAAPIDVIRDAQMLVLTSDFEGIPNVVLEAFAVGLPVISTDCSPGGARFLLGDSEYGLLVPKGDVFGISLAMTRMADNKKEADFFAKKGRIRLQNFNPSKIIDMWDAYLKKIVCFRGLL